MSPKRHITLLLCLLAYAASLAQHGGKAPLVITTDETEVMEVHFQLPEITLSHSNQGFCQLECKSLAMGNGHVGHPDLPTFSVLIRLPQGSRLEVNSLTSKETTLEGLIAPDRFLVPVTEAWIKDQPQPEYHPDSKIYGDDAFYRGGEKLEVDHLGRMGTAELFLLTVRPIAYNPVTGALKTSNIIEASLHPTLSTSHAPLAIPRFLIVSRPEFQEGLQPFVRWKRQEGYDVVERYVDTPQHDSIKAIIRPLFEDLNLPSPEYILIVGDVDQIQSFPGTVLLEETMHITDLYYGDYSGDYLPEAMVGRWPVNDTAELNAVVCKTLAYEQFHNIDTLQLERILLVAGKENASTAPITTNGQVNYLKREVKLTHPEMDTVCYHNPASDTLLNAIVEDIGLGASLLNYTAHCTEAGWTHPALRSTNIDSAGGNQAMVYVNNCCKSNNFVGDCFGEQLLRMPVGGAVGVIGATNSTLWNEDYYWAVGPKYPLSLTPDYDSTALGAFDRLLGRTPTFSTLGELLIAGNLAVTAFGSPYTKFYWEIYALLGDPSLMPYIGAPSPIEITATEGLVNGSFNIGLTGTPGARVAALQGDSLLGVATIAADGHATLSLRQSLDTLPLILTATGHGLQPRIDTLTVSTPFAEGVALRNIAVTDSTVKCIVENIGQQRIDSLHVMLVQSPNDTLAGALIAEQTLAIDSLLPEQQTAAVLPVAVEAIGMHSLWQATLLVWHDSLLCSVALSHNLPQELSKITFHLLNPDSSEARLLLPGHQYLLYGEVTGDYDSLTIYANATLEALSSQTPFLSFTTPDSLCDLHIGGILYHERWHSQNEYHLEPGNRIESFEKGFEGHPWHNNSRVPWVIDSTVSHSGRYSARSGAIDHSQLTDLCIEVFLPHKDTISFWSKSSTETQYDKMVFSIDGQRRLPDNWGIFDWQQFKHILTPGHHTLCWRYIKDNSHSAGSDCIWIDDIRLPMSLWDSAGSWECVTPTLDIDYSPFSTQHSPLSVFPNPASTRVTLHSNREMMVTVSDTWGRKVASFALREGEMHQWDVSALPSGVYFIVGSDADALQGAKLIIQKD